jgi:coenzyme F420 biosynthesis associated uncharacterized protein
MSSAPSPVDWARAEQVARLIATRHATPPSHLAGWNPPIELIEQQIEDVTGLRSAAGTATAELIDRPTWIHANIVSFKTLLEPVLDRLSELRPTGSGAGAATALTRQLTAVELGTLLGWMSTRVLGQYDVLVGRDTVDVSVGAIGTADPSALAIGTGHAIDTAGAIGTGDGAVYLVAGNLASAEVKYGFDPVAFRTWVLVHELTHRAQFTGVPWMRGYFTGLVDQALKAVNPDPQALLNALKDALRNRAEARQQVRDSGIAGLIAGPEQRRVIARIGGLMSLLEGHGDVTMTRAAGDLVPNADRFARVLAERRRRSNPLSRLILRLTGMEGKLNQYAAGERFIGEVEAVGGPRVIDTCWTSPEHLPSLDEIRSPELWLRRMGQLVA